MKQNKKSFKWLLIIFGILVALGVIGSVFTYWSMTDLYRLKVPAYIPVEEGSQTFPNGDRIYSPSTDNIAFDSDRAILYYDNLLLVMTDQDLPHDRQEQLAACIDGEVVGTVSGAIHAVQIQVSESTLSQLEAMSEKLMEQEDVMYAYSDYPVQIMSCSEPWGGGDDYGNEAFPSGYDWWAEAIGAYTAWEYADQCQSVKLGIVDTGYDTEHEDLEDQLTIVSTYNTLHDHGTHVAGIMGANHNDVGLRGIAPSAELYGADVWAIEGEDDSYHTMAELLEVYSSMAQSGVKAVNNSWGCYMPPIETFAYQRYGNSFHNKLFFNRKQLQQEYQSWIQQRLTEDLIPTAEASIVLIAQLMQSGYEDFLIVQAAGNESIDAINNGFFSSITEEVFNNMDSRLSSKLTQSGITYRHIDDRVMIVGAASCDWEGHVYDAAYFSNYGPTVDIFAPGDDIFSTIPMELGMYESYSGTSMAAPMVTASAGYLWALNPELPLSEVRNLLLEQTPNRVEYNNRTYPMLHLGTAVKALMEG